MRAAPSGYGAGQWPTKAPAAAHDFRDGGRSSWSRWRPRRCTSCCPGSRAWTRRGAGSPRATHCGWRRACCSRSPSYGAYVFTLPPGVRAPGSPIGWRESYDISLAGVAASRLLATAGAGGIALSAWALLHSGMRRRAVASERHRPFYVGALRHLHGRPSSSRALGLRTGVLPGPAPFAITVVPALFAGSMIAAALIHRAWCRATSAIASARAWPDTTAPRRGWGGPPGGRPPSRRACAARSACCAVATRR